MESITVSNSSFITATDWVTETDSSAHVSSTTNIPYVSIIPQVIDRVVEVEVIKVVDQNGRVIKKMVNGLEVETDNEIIDLPCDDTDEEMPSRFIDLGDDE